MNSFYTDARNIQILIYLLKMHGIKKIVASPGTTNMTFVASIQRILSLKYILLQTSVLRRILHVVLLQNRESQ